MIGPSAGIVPPSSLALASSLRRRWRSARDYPPCRPGSTVAGSSREMDVLQLVAEGLTNTAIAERLVLSPRTVETHVANLVTKTKVHGRSGLTRLVKSGTTAD